MTVPSDDNIYSTCRIESRCKLLVIFNTDMCEQNGKINIDRAVCITDLADLGRRILNIYQGADQAFTLCVCQHFFGQYSYEQYAHPIDLFDDV